MRRRGGNQPVARPVPSSPACGTRRRGRPRVGGPRPPAMRNIPANRYYSDAASSIIDPALKRQNELAVKPLEDYLRNFSRMADLYVRSGAQPVAVCALDWLDAWAQGDAMLGSMSSRQAEYHRKWILAGL